MPRTLDVDWEVAKVLWLQGVSATVISRQLKIKLSTLNKHADRHRWRQSRDDLHKPLSDALQRDLKHRAESAMETLTRHAEDTLKIAQTLPIPTSWGKLAETEQVMQMLQKRVRNVFGLDQETGGNRGIVNIQVLSSAPGTAREATQAQIVDVEGEKTPGG